ncbi:hypothetical protein ACFY1S_06525 [Micromonospora sp. NPDC000663]|uniref:hypothetical protein n=1 Tax=Micromonospora sp. NPDC000663 TaxID=3364218 RepID=UPI0036BABBF9
MDISIAILIALAAAYAGTVVWLAPPRPLNRARAARAALGTAASIVGAFAVMILLAGISLLATNVVAALGAAVMAYLVLSHDLGATRARIAATVAGLLIGLSFVFLSYLAVMALIGAAGVYLILRKWTGTRPALLVMGGALGCLLLASAGAFALALSSM